MLPSICNSEFKWYKIVSGVIEKIADKIKKKLNLYL